jgi:hypothetical protein
MTSTASSFAMATASMTESSEKNDVEERDLNHCPQKTASQLCNRPLARSLEFDVDLMGAFGDEKQAAGKKDQVSPADEKY